MGSEMCIRDSKIYEKLPTVQDVVDAQASGWHHFGVRNERETRLENHILKFVEGGNDQS